jgi:hypothetical protein
MTRPVILSLVVAAALGAGCGKDIVCAQGELLCDGHCTSVQIDSNHCGTCGHACGAYQECNAGACECGPGTTQLTDGCFDLRTSPAHCGAADVSCQGGQVCATTGDVTTCADACPGGLQTCEGGCVDLQTDRWNCGGCGQRCDRGESCRAGACGPDLYVACFATDQVYPVDATLRSGLPRAAGDGPIGLAVGADRLWVAASISHSLVSLPLAFDQAGREQILGGADLEGIFAANGLVYVSDTGSSSLVVANAVTGQIVDEIVLGGDNGINPHGIAAVGDRVYVALYGTDAQSGGQEIVAVAGAGSAAGGAVAKRISVAALADPPGLAFPSRVVAVGTKVYGTLANLKLDPTGQYYSAPAGPSKLAVIDTASDDALGAVSLGADCTDAGDVTANGTTLWIVCGGTGKLLSVDVSGETPVVGAAIASSFAGPGNIAFCGGMGYVTDQWSGTVERFDPLGGEQPSTAVLCPTSAAGWSWAADVACAP